MFGKTFWNYGLGVHLGVVTTISLSAYAGILPTTYKIIPHADLFGHLVLVGLLAFFLDGTFRFRALFSGRLAFLRLAPALMIVIAALEELTQSFSPRRTASLSDFLADVLGIVLGSWLAKYLVERYGDTSGAK